MLDIIVLDVIFLDVFVLDVFVLDVARRRATPPARHSMIELGTIASSSKIIRDS